MAARLNPKFYIRRFECWGGSFVYCVAERDTRKVASSMFKQRKTAEKLLERMEADWERWLNRERPFCSPRLQVGAVRQSRGERR